ncbi:hypothetical protein SCHPADRAFT_911053 [Schizopora paradoxa]|uniref:Nucleic acid-binding protein n=1 Tax=Schizopora paradoxa TaxID=27342 RepID=A0A0H2R0Z0_9AGAM|nr:hypothetical protein SCHPADRAFT_911053 [Schizopora paradoxa]
MAGVGDEDDDVSLSLSQRFSPSEDKEDWDFGPQPVSIKQVLASKPDSSHGHFVCDGQQMRLVTLVAAVVNTLDTSDGLRVDLQDGGEGLVSGYWKFRSMKPSWEGFELESGSYVRIIGKIVQPAGGGRRDADTDSDAYDHLPRNYLKLDRLRLVADRHEIFYHILEVLKFTRMRRTGSIPEVKTKTNGSQIGELVDSTGRLGLSDSETGRKPSTQQNPSQSREFSFNKNNALGLTDSPLLRERVSNTSKASTSSFTQSNRPSPPQVSRELEVRTAKAPQRTLSGQSTLVDSPISQSPVRTRASSPSPQDADPYSHLSNLERAIHLHLLNAKANGTKKCHISYHAWC